MGRLLLHVDPKLCNGCKACELACSLFREGECNPSLSRITVIIDNQSARFTPVVCTQCSAAACREACPKEALPRDGETQAVLVDGDACIGCMLCIFPCPVPGAVFPDPREGAVAVLKCDLCGGDPECVKFCEPAALSVVRVDRANRWLARRRVGSLTPPAAALPSPSAQAAQAAGTAGSTGVRRAPASKKADELNI